MATDAAGVIQIFKVGAEAMLGHDTLDMVDQVTPADISDPAELIKRASGLSAELGTPIAPGLKALVSKAKRGIEDSYELTRPLPTFVAHQEPWAQDGADAVMALTPLARST